MTASVAMADINLVTGLEQCPEGYKVETGAAMLQWVKQNQAFIDLQGGLTATQVEELKRGGHSAKYTLFFVNPASVLPTPTIKPGQAAVIQLSRIDLRWTTGSNGGGTAATTPPGTAPVQTPESVLNPFMQTLPPEQQEQFRTQVSEQQLTIKYQMMIWAFLQERGIVVYNKELLSLLRPVSIQQLESLEEQNAYLQFQVNQLNAAILNSMNGGQEMANELIDILRQNGTQEFEQLVALINAIGQQNYVMRDQVRLLEKMAERSGWKLEAGAVARDLVNGTQINGSVFNYYFGGGSGSGSHFVNHQQCEWVPVDYSY